MGGKEIELKLAVPAESLATLKHSVAITRHQQGEARVARLTSIYYDTPDQLLAKAGITVRLRQDGSVWLQTVKTAGSRASGLFSRQEWEEEVPNERLDASLLRATGLPLLAESDLPERMGPLFATHVTRHTALLQGEGWQAELALDLGEIRAGAQRLALSEAELELRKGEPRHLFALARQIAQEVPARLLASSKSDRGYALASARAPSPIKAKPVALEPEMDMAEAFRAIARNCLHHLLANEPSLADHADPEAVHQMRVALRRLRSALKIFGPLVTGTELDRIRADIKWLLAVLGPARDTDVFVSEIIAPVAERHAGHAGMAALQAHWAERRERDLANAVEAVRDRRFTLLLLDLGAWVEAGDWCTDPDLPGHALKGEHLAPFARAVLAKQARRMRKAGGKRLAKLAPHDRHQVRILGKQMRYAGEFFSCLYDARAAKDYLTALADLQDALGTLNDVAVAAARLSGGAHPGEQDWAAGKVAGWHEARQPKLMDKAEKAWKRWRRRKGFWGA